MKEEEEGTEVAFVKESPLDRIAGSNAGALFFRKRNKKQIG
jgi:hypothetical protein